MLLLYGTSHSVLVASYFYYIVRLNVTTTKFVVLSNSKIHCGFIALASVTTNDYSSRDDSDSSSLI